jgi:uncharacterized protein (DUF1015 family)
MITHQEYAKQNNLTIKQARTQLDQKIADGQMVRKRQKGFYIYCETMTFRWHDPFNKIERKR